MNQNKVMQLSLILLILTQSARDLIIEFSMAMSRGLMTFIYRLMESVQTQESRQMQKTLLAPEFESKSEKKGHWGR